ncbi:MAG: hybrid sensor histidine kinase/response regulator [Vicinamibacteria bacterium]
MIAPRDRPDAPGIRVKCLLVDDREENLIALGALLRRDDVELLTARSGAEALDLLLAHEVALAFLDVQMPEMDGFELAELMRGSERTRHVPIIFVTAGPRDQHRLFKGYDRGAVDFLYKPIEPQVLRNKAEVFFQLYTQKQQLLRELSERTETLRLNEMFAAVLGHDLRTPLAAVLASARLLQEVPSEDAVRRAAARILSSGDRMGRMIDDMLDLARARLAGGLAVRPDGADLGVLVQRVLPELQGAVPERLIELRTEGDLRGRWDADRLAQVVSNLVGNAIEHGQPETPIALHLDGSRPYEVRVLVANAGVIPPALLPRVFDPFRREARPNGKSDGLGLGLYIAQQIVQAHGGAIAVESAGGRTTFTVTLPREVR